METPFENVNISTTPAAAVAITASNISSTTIAATAATGISIASTTTAAATSTATITTLTPASLQR